MIIEFFATFLLNDIVLLLIGVLILGSLIVGIVKKNRLLLTFGGGLLLMVGSFLFAFMIGYSTVVGGAEPFWLDYVWNLGTSLGFVIALVSLVLLIMRFSDRSKSLK